MMSRSSLRTFGALAVSVAAFVPLAAYAQVTPADVVDTYADIAEAGYTDALLAAEALQAAIDALIATPSEATLEAARAAWIAARPAYQQTEVFRFGNPIVDEWEGRVNAWPLDEGLIDYVDAAYGTENDVNAFYALNVIANPIITIGGQTIDATAITPAFLQDTLQELGGVESNVATGYHAIEFLLWGQDLNGTGPGAGDRPFTDYDLANCTGGNCDRRAAYLSAATDLLVTDLEEMVANWQEGGAARLAVTTDATEGLRAVFMGLGSLSFGELAGERIKLGLLVHDPEEEHDCFSDNTFNSHFYDVIGIQNVYLGRYVRTDGTVIEGPSPADLVAAASVTVNDELLQKLDATVAAATTMKTRGETVEGYDQMIAEGNAEGNAVVQAVVDALVDQTASIERAIAALGLGPIELERSQALDNPNAVFQ
ncbi:MAG: peptidase [Bauldia sp.]|nr:peptidase [Bauldia sp.]